MAAEVRPTGVLHLAAVPPQDSQLVSPQASIADITSDERAYAIYGTQLVRD